MRKCSCPGAKIVEGHCAICGAGVEWFDDDSPDATQAPLLAVPGMTITAPIGDVDEAHLGELMHAALHPPTRPVPPWVHTLQTQPDPDTAAPHTEAQVETLLVDVINALANGLTTWPDLDDAADMLTGCTATEWRPQAGGIRLVTPGGVEFIVLVIQPPAPRGDIQPDELCTHCGQRSDDHDFEGHCYSHGTGHKFTRAPEGHAPHFTIENDRG